MIRLIASDLDGTLIPTTTASIPQEFIETIKELKKKGILFAAASGRQYYNLRNLFHEVQDDIAYICENGALTIYQHNIIDQIEIPKNTANEIIRRLEAEPGTETLVSGTYTCYINPKEPSYEEYIRNMNNKYKVIPDLTAIEEPIIKLALYEKEGTECRNRQNYWQPQFPDPIKVVTSGPLWLDFIFPEANKGTGIRALARHLHIRQEEILSFGDNYNDVEMFEASGTRVAVENARPGIRELCDYTTPSVNKFIRRMLDMEN